MQQCRCKNWLWKWQTTLPSLGSLPSLICLGLIWIAISNLRIMVSGFFWNYWWQCTTACAFVLVLSTWVQKSSKFPLLSKIRIIFVYHFLQSLLAIFLVELKSVHEIPQTFNFFIPLFGLLFSSKPVCVLLFMIRLPSARFHILDFPSAYFNCFWNWSLPSVITSMFIFPPTTLILSLLIYYPRALKVSLLRTLDLNAYTRRWLMHFSGTSTMGREPNSQLWSTIYLS